MSVVQPDRFDAAIRSLVAVNRRSMLRGIAVGATAALAIQPGRAAPTPSSRGHCAAAGAPCKHGAQCCSGVCHRNKCRQAPNQGTCTIRLNQCVDPYPASACNGPGGCACFVTTAGASFCGGEGVCVSCATDADCVQLGHVGASCVRSSGDHCCGGDNGTACLQPCPIPAP